MKPTQYITIKNAKIPVIIRNYKTSKYLKMYFKTETLYVSKPKYVSMKKALEFIQENEEYVYSTYIKIITSENKKTKKWQTGEKFYIKGEEYRVIVSNSKDTTIKTSHKSAKTNQNEDTKNKEKTTTRVTISLKIDEQNKQLNITYPEKLDNIDKTTRKQYIDKGIKQLLKNNTENLLLERVPYWSKITNIPYKEFKVNDATSKFGSCISKTKVLHFSSRLIILPPEKIDAVIVHELCHILYPNHSQNFYNLVKKFIPNYDEINKWLKKNGKMILF